MKVDRQQRASLLKLAARDHPCPTCGAEIQSPCTMPDGRTRKSNHQARYDLVKQLKYIKAGRDPVVVPEGAITCKNVGSAGWLVYGIKDVAGGRFGYVGQTGNLEKRMRAHARDIERAGITRRRVKWMCEVIRAGGALEFVVLEQCLSEEASLAAETNWVARLSAQGHPLRNSWTIHQEIIADYNQRT